jgi:predicted ArsR family transcriptional regulator
MSRNQALDKKKLLERLHKMPIVEAACKQIGLPRATYYRWRKDDEEFARACDDAIEQSAGMINDLAESQLIAAIKDKNMSAIMFWLKHHHAAYETRLRVDGRISHQTEELTPEQSDLIEKALHNAGLLLAEQEISDET